MTGPARSPFPRLVQAWRFARLAGVGFASQAAAGLAHLVWADRTAIAVAAVAAAEVAYRRVFPAGRLDGQLAALVAAYRQITAAVEAPAKTAAPAAPAEPAAPAAATPAVTPPPADTVPAA